MPRASRLEGELWHPCAMRRLPSRWLNLLVIVVSVALALCLGALALRPYVERAVRNWIAAEAGKRGLVVRIGAIRAGFWPLLRLSDVSVESGSRWRLTAEVVEGWWRGRSTLVVKKASFQGPAGITVAAPATEWEVEVGDAGSFSAGLLQPYSGLVVKKASRPGEHQWSIEATELPVARIFDLRRFEQPVADVGTISGTLHLAEGRDAVRFEADLASRSARLPALERNAARPAALGGPTGIKAEVAGTWKPAQEVLDVPRWSAWIEGAAASGSLTLRDIKTDPGVDLALEVERVDFTRLLRTWGLEAPESLRAKSAAAGDLGSATLSATARGRVSEPAAFVVTQKLDFSPPKPMPPAVVKLQGDFVHQAVAKSGVVQTISVSPASPDFIPLDQVPPLFLRALLIAEDAGFYGHSGIDLREVPAALITDWTRGGAARGASTITQQLAKNLFLSREKHLGRKVQELSVTLLLEAALGKRRILEIYLNVIEWGPGLYGLRPAARTYFDREPADLTPAQMAFLISIIPGPLKYQSSFAHGTPGPGLRKLIDNLLAKLRSVDALSEEEYQKALAEEIVVSGRQAPPRSRPAPCRKRLRKATRGLPLRDASPLPPGERAAARHPPGGFQREPGIPVSGAAPPRAAGLDRRRLERLGQQPARQVLPADRQGAEAAGERGTQLGACRGRGRAHLADGLKGTVAGMSSCVRKRKGHGRMPACPQEVPGEGFSQDWCAARGGVADGRTGPPVAVVH